MQVRKCGSAYLIRLEIGESIIPTLSAFVRKKGILSGWIQGLGAVNQVTIGTYDISHKKYVRKELPGDQELVNMTGNLAWLGKEPVFHLHATFADDRHHVTGGHLFEACTCVTVEVLLVPWHARVVRQPDEPTGLNLLALGVSRRPT